MEDGRRMIYGVEVRSTEYEYSVHVDRVRLDLIGPEYRVQERRALEQEWRGEGRDS